MAPLADVLRDESGFFSRPEENWTPGWMGQPGKTAQEDAYEMQRANAAQAISEAYNPVEDFAPVGKVAKALKFGGGMLAAGALIPKTKAAVSALTEMEKSFAPPFWKAINATAPRKGKVIIKPYIPSKDVDVHVSSQLKEELKNMGMMPTLKARGMQEEDLDDVVGAYVAARKGTEDTPFILSKEEGKAIRNPIHEAAHLGFNQLRPSTIKHLAKSWVKRKEDIINDLLMTGDEVGLQHLEKATMPTDAVSFVIGVNETLARMLQGRIFPVGIERKLLTPLGRQLAYDSWEHQIKLPSTNFPLLPMP